MRLKQIENQKVGYSLCSLKELISQECFERGDAKIVKDFTGKLLLTFVSPYYRRKDK